MWTTNTSLLILHDIKKNPQKHAGFTSKMLFLMCNKYAEQVRSCCCFQTLLRPLEQEICIATFAGFWSLCMGLLLNPYGAYRIFLIKRARRVPLTQKEVLPCIALVVFFILASSLTSRWKSPTLPRNVSKNFPSSHNNAFSKKGSLPWRRSPACDVPPVRNWQVTDFYNHFHY